MRALFAALTLMAVAFAGCSGGGGGNDPTSEEKPSAYEGVETTEDTGAIVGIVVSEAIVPMAGVTITVANTDLAATTDLEGAFLFNGLAPGDYFLTATKLGFQDVQQSATVVAGDDEPPLVKIQLLADPTGLVYATTEIWEGYVVCAAKAGADGVAFGGGHICGDEAGSRFIKEFPFADGKFPTYVQTELIWDNTQPTGDTLEVTYWRALTTDWKRSDGTSPVLLAATAEEIHSEEQARDENMTSLTVRVFPGSVTPVSATVNQAFRLYQTYFYGFTPHEGWTFAEEGACEPAEKCAP